MAKQLSPDKKEKVKALLLKYRSEAEEGNECTFERMCRSERFKIGGEGQWDGDDYYANQKKGKFALSINQCLPIVLNVAGTEEQNPLDYVVRNVKGGTATVADVLSALQKNVMDKSTGQEEGGRAFEAGITNGRGFIGAEISYKHDPANGDIVVKQYDTYMVLPDPTCTAYDYNQEIGGAKYIIVDEWIDKNKVELTYPRHKQAIRNANFEADPTVEGGFFTRLFRKCSGNKGATNYTKDSYRRSECDEYDANTDKQRFNYRKSTYWWKEYKKGVYVQVSEDPLNFISLTDPKAISEARDMAEASQLAATFMSVERTADAAAILVQSGLAPDVTEEQLISGEAEVPGVTIIDKDGEGNPLTVCILNKTIMYGDVLVDHIPDPFQGVTLFPIARFAPYFDLGYEYSIVENLISPQQMVNYSASTRANILKNLANTGYKVQKGTQPHLEWLEDHGNEDGVIINESDYGKVEKIIQTPYPTGYDAEVTRHKEDMREIAQVDVDAAPGTGGTESGRALAIREAQSTKTKGVPFRNWRHTNLIFANFLTELIRFTDVFSDDEIGAILDEEDLIDDTTMDAAKGIIFRQLEEQGKTIPDPPQPPNPIRMNLAPPELQADMLDQFQEELKVYEEFVEQVEAAAIPIAKDITISMVRQKHQGRYGVKIDISPMAPTRRIAANLELLGMNKSLIESGQAGISRDDMIDASEIANKDKVKKNVPQAAVA